MTKDIAKRNETVTANAREMDALQAFFPACFDKEGNFDLAKFQELLKDKVSLKREGYGLNFLGKNYARMLASLDSTTVVVPDEEHNSKPENKDSENIYITGDNLDGLKQLLHSYSGRIKCIYIDPPYNTGSDGFVYNDKFTFTAEGLAAKLSIDEDEAERILKLTKKGSASHSAWLMFMYPRLMLARDMLRDDGVIFISIDDNEQANLKLLCDDVFGEQNNLASISVVVKTEGRRYGAFAKSHEYVLSYGKDEDLTLNEIEVPDAEFAYSDSIGGFNLTELRNQNARAFNSLNRPNLRYPFYVDINNPDSDGLCVVSTEQKEGYVEVWAITTNGYDSVWRWGKETSQKEIENITARKGTDGVIRIYQKYRKLTQTAKTVWIDKSFISNKGTVEVQELFGNGVFDYPKPLGLVKQIINIGSDDNSIILDFFSGSATTAHAVMQLNAEDEGNRKYIMVQLAEPVKPGSEAEKAGYTTIDEIGRKRIELAAAKIKAEHSDTKADLGYKHFTLAEPSQETLDKLEKFVPEAEDGLDNMLNNDIFHAFGLQTVLATWLVRDGYGLATRPEAVDFAGYTGYYIGRHLYLIEEGMTDEAVTAIVEKYDSDKKFQADNLVVFGYNFGWTKLQALRDNLIRLKDTEKNLRVMFDVRY